jgi:DNA mismatch repair protein MutS
MDINKLLNSKDKLLIEVYFDIQQHFEQKYGENTVVLMEIGSFFESYEVNNDELKVGKAKIVSELLNIQLTKKNKNIAENSIKNPYLSGIPSISLSRHLDKIVQEDKFTVVIIKQKGVPPKVSRYIDQIITPGTNFDFIKSDDANYICTLLFDYNYGIYSVGFSAIDVTTGKTVLFETHGTKDDKKFALDEVFNLLTTYKSNELIIRCEDELVLDEILEYLEIKDNFNYHVINKKLKINYQNTLLQKVYQIESLLSPIEYLHLERTPLISESLTLLIDFIIEHDFEVISKLKPPTIIDNTKHMYLGNSAAYQLDIISNDKDKFTIFKLINKTRTAIGKRLLQERLLNPITDLKELNNRYSICEKLTPYLENIEIELKNIYDIERIIRRVTINKLNPYEIIYLYTSLKSIENIFNIVKKDKILDLYFDNNLLKSFYEFLHDNFDFNKCVKVAINEININFFQAGINKDIDQLELQNLHYEKELENISKKLDNIYENKCANLEEYEKDGHYISVTRNRYKLIEEKLHDQMVFCNDKPIYFKDFRVRILSNVVKISHPVIDEISSKIIQNRLKIVSITKEIYLEKLDYINKNFTNLSEDLVDFISQVDVACSNIKVSSTYNLTKPIIKVQKDDKTFIKALAIRHPLIEIQENRGIYVPNDIILDDKIKGILLYGINSSGKSSLMKALGICIILAQSGFFVPAKLFEFSLLNSLFTRIVSNDNLSKGLSTFAVEMLELKNIFNRADSNSLILGDEISHGTETISGVSIVSSAIMKLSKLNSLFLFATHLHQLNSIEEVEVLKNVKKLHLSVKYDEKDDKLIFDRKLKEGSGSSVYGLEFAKSLHMDKEFLDNANKIRKKLINDYDDIELIKANKSSKYNKNLIITKCAICQKPVDDVHHIKEKQSANKDGFIDHFHQNHKYNLIPLCKQHHKDVHDGKIIISGFFMTDKGLQLAYREC